ncbi:hypothetical protein HS088_TW09G01112 [Tripterygium wilfordii]|uniref:Uncharacterized protein n=1 Tax=Tripterygium wilfordii TaxID=458696 RepID=A0A7J7D9K7_TRIWF|nr:hypothetical protein HS088_TW09G01112 [Tripterygium wilfordii]
MPGTIQVSVLGFIGLESSSTPSQTSIKVSMGKRAYQTVDKGDFSFPLATFRDKLVIALQDAEGNEISHTGVDTRLVVEKGTWDDRFPLGGGHVHLKLQFILSEEDRQRIRSRRELALKKKKHQELPSSKQHQMRRSFSHSDVGTSLYLNCEVSDSQDRLIQIEAEQADGVSNPPNFFGIGKSGPKVIEETHSVHRPTPNDTDIYKQTSTNTHVPQEFDIHPAEASNKNSGEKVETQKPSIDVPMRAISSEGVSTSFKNSGSNIAAKTKSNTPKLDKDKANKSEKQSPSEKTPSNVRNMISAFENSLSQDTRLQITVPLEKSQPIKTGRIASPLPTKELQEDPTYIRKRGELTNFPGGPEGATPSKDSGQLKGVNPAKSQADGISVDLKNESKVIHKETEVEEKETSSQGTMRTSTGEVALVSERSVDLKNESKIIHKEAEVEEKETSSQGMMRTSTGEVASVSKKTIDDQSSKHRPINLSVQRHFRKESCKGVCLDDSRGEDVHKYSNEKLRSRMAWEDEHNFLESSGVWIYPDGVSRLCITTGGKQIMDLMDSCWPEAETQEGNTSSAPYNVEELQESVHSSVDIKERTSQRQRSSKVDRSRNIETPGGPFGQWRKIAIMVGFATFVLLTRQRNADG